MENGTYPARPTGNVHIGDHSNGCLICNMEFAFDGGGTIFNTFWLTTKDGAINTRTIDTLKEIFGWDGADPFWLEDHASELADIAVDLVVENETFIGKQDGLEHTALKVKWVNSVGGGGGNKIENSDRQALMSKYGAKLRAVSGGTPAAKKPSAPPVPKQPDLAPAPVPSAPPAIERPATMVECWKAINDRMAGKARPEIEAKWYELIKQVHGDKAQNTFTDGDWGAVLDRIDNVLPF